MSRIYNSMYEETQKKLQALPDIFYRYTFDETIHVMPVKKKMYSERYTVFEYELCQSDGKTRICTLSDPDTIRFGIFDGRRKCVFFKESGKEHDAAIIFDQVYEDQIATYEKKVAKCILKRRDLQQIIKKGDTNGTGI